MEKTTAERRAEVQKIYFPRASKKPIPNYPFPSSLDKQMAIPSRREKYADFCKWEANNLKNLEFWIMLAKKIIISKTEIGFACIANPEGIITLSNLLLENLDKSITDDLLKKEGSNEITEEAILKIVWKAVKKNILAKKEELRIYSQS